MREGFYAVYVQGMAGATRALLAIDHGQISGVDMGNARYSGRYEYNPRTDLVDIDLRLEAPPGSAFVQNGEMLTHPTSFRVCDSLPRDVEKHIMSVETPLGPVHVHMERIGDLPG